MCGVSMAVHGEANKRSFQENSINRKAAVLTSCILKCSDIKQYFLLIINDVSQSFPVKHILRSSTETFTAFKPARGGFWFNTLFATDFM